MAPATALIQLLPLQQDTLMIPAIYQNEGIVKVASAVSDYWPESAEALRKIALNFRWINRKGKRMRGYSYSLRMAQNDFKASSRLPTT
ncbi:hypothetical protein WBJ53_17795 [Spirosoma sp. SC4-14]|uniref:hypothetical protein n=1 Tax=Spirosoma sp. SC4-14 TaxID=3128900 RepID=UPI0030D00835